VDSARDRVVLIEEIDLSRGDWRAGGLDMYVAFGAPGPPLAVDARLSAAATGEPASHVDGAGDPITVEAGVRRGPGVSLLLGKAQMAGARLRIKDAQLRRAFAPADHAELRIRMLLRPPAIDSSGAREIVARLGIHGGLPMTLGRIQIASLDTGTRITRAEAKLCGPEADPWPLSVAIAPRLAGGRSDRNPGSVIAPSMAVRHDSDDLCIRWWVSP
jgi:hypothetical protein